MADSTLKNRAGYDEDFYAWCLDQAERARRGLDLDLPNIAEEIESMGNSDRRALDSHLTNLLVHLLKWQVQPDFRGASWHGTIQRCRDDIEDIIEVSPSLASRPGEILAQRFKKARRRASLETKIDLGDYPESCPWTIEEILDEGFLPATQT